MNPLLAAVVYVGALPLKAAIRMQRMPELLGLSLALLLSCGNSTSAPLHDPLEDLRSGHVSLVESEYSSLQKRFEKGDASEYELLDAYKPFYQREDRYRPYLDNWIAQYPASSSAYLARGVYLRKLGESRRGDRYISETPRENVDYMLRMFAASKLDLKKALQLNPKSYLAVVHLLNIAQFEGDNAAANEYLSMGNALLPSNFIVRARYLIHLTPRWGGTYAAMDLFIEQCRSEGVKHDQINMLMAIKENDLGEVWEERGNFSQARAEYEQALHLSRSAGKRFRRDYLGYALSICAQAAYRGKDFCL